MSALKSDCRKFSPNVFNKTKCQNCFRTKDAHSAEALENNRASRNVSKCGYLFVAPDWDFNVSINRTKRWQRRWFVLYDDGELTYALDEFPDTIPQATIDMNKVLDVSDAESVTGNDFAISITTADKAHFIKGTSKEESKWWFDVLCRVSPRHFSRGKHKRNATFPCGKATIPTTAVIAQEYCSEDDMRVNSYGRPKFLSSSGLLQNEKDWIPSVDPEEDEDVFPANEDNVYLNNSDCESSKRDVEARNALNKLISQSEEIQDELQGQTNRFDAKLPKDCLSQLEELDARRRNRRYLKRENRVQRNQRSRNDGVSKMIPFKNRSEKNNNSETPDAALHSNGSAMAAAEKLEYLESIHSVNDKQSNTRPSSALEQKDMPSSEKVSDSVNNSLGPTNLRKSESLKNIPSEAQSEIRDHVSGLRRYHSFKSSTSHRKMKPGSTSSSLKRTKNLSTTHPKTLTTPSTSVMVCSASDSKINGEAVSPTSPNISYEHTNEGVFMRTGWLMRQTFNKDWSKHWFVLRDSSLTYYRDPSAEHCGIMDGILDLNQVSTIRDVSTDRYYAFSLLMWDGKKHVLAAETKDFRDMWMQALQYASNLWSSASKEDFICSEIILPEHTFHHSDRSVDKISSPSSLSSLPYIYGNNLLETSSSSSSDDQSEYFSLVDEDEISDLSSSPRTLPPSPPINRNMMSLVKEKSRSRSICGLKTSTPSSGTDCNVCDNRGVDRNSDKQQDHFDRPLYGDKLSPDQDAENASELSRELLSCSQTGSPTKFSDESFSHLSEDTDSIQFRLEFEDNLSKITDASDSDFRTPDISITKAYPCENLLSSTPKSEMIGECPMCGNVKSKLLAAKEEIRKLKTELKEAHSNFDNLEMFSYKLTQDIKMKEDNYNSQIALMTAKIDDLTSKFSLAEKNYRQLKQKTTKSEGKERKRSSLKSKEGLSLTKEYELKLCDLERKVGQIETTLQKESVDARDSETSQSNEQHKVNEDCCRIVSESSDTSSSTDLSPTANKGFLSRLQSLGSKVQNVEELVSEKNTAPNELKNPKILLEVRDLETSSHLDEDHLWALSFNNSYKNLEKIMHGQPNNLLECQGILLRKINKILRWLKSSLDKICKNSNLSGDQILLSQTLIDLLDSLCLKIPRDASEPNQEKIFQTFLMAFEIMGHLIRVSDVDNIDSLIKVDITKFAFKVIVKTMCIAFAEYNHSDVSHVLQLVSEIPQVRFFCPILNKLLPENLEEVVQYSSISERFKQLADQKSSILNGLHEAKRVRYELLWDTLTEVPVQDDGMARPRTVNSIQNYVTSIATNVYRIAELQLHGLQKQSSYILKAEQHRANLWCQETEKALTDNLIEFMDELKERCPMVYERTVSLDELNEFTRNAIACYVAELSFFCVSHTVLNSLLHHPFETIFSNETRASSLPMTGNDCLRSFQTCRSNFLTNTAFFECLQCCTLSNILCDSVNETNWSDFVKKYNACNPRRFDLLNYKSETLNTNLNGTCAKCDGHFSDSTAGNTKDMCNNLTCTECEKWLKKICASEEQHEQERKALESKYSQDVQQLEECLIKSSEIHEKEMLQKESELESITAQLQSLKIEYEAQIRALQNLYEKKLHLDCDGVNEDRIREAYKSEIEDLKDMFKKGLLEIESSHYRITTEIERKHKDEISILKAEKDRALEIEAQATITALEAIRKSYELQLKEETAIIKEDLIRKFQSGEQNETFYCKYGNDLEKLKGEILNITELYSAKCMENIALEDKVNTLRQQLDEAHKELCSLLMKNKEIDLSLLHV